MSFLTIPYIAKFGNLFFGIQSGQNLKLGTNNTGFGFNAALSITNGGGNSAFGRNALSNVTNGSGNTGIGEQAAPFFSTGGDNTVVGAVAATFLTGGDSSNSIFGAGSNARGSGNSFFGAGAGSQMVSGQKNSILGRFSGNQGGLDIRTLSNYIVLSDGDGNPRLWITDTGAVNIPGGISLTGSLTITGGTVTANNPVLSATQTWNNAAVTFTGWRLNVTDTASNAASLLMDLQVGGVSRFSITKNGMIQGPNSPFEIRTFSTNPLDILINNQRFFSFNTSDGFRLGSGLAVCWANSSNDVNFPRDLFLFRDAANTLAQRNGVNAQTLRVYNTFTDASNYERGILQWSASILTIGAENAGTGLARDVVLQGGNRLYLRAGGVTSWEVNASNGHFFAATDNSYDIGATGANRPRNVFWAGYQQMSEMTAPAAPAANSVRIYAEDNGSGKTRLMALFATGAAQQIAIEP